MPRRKAKTTRKTRRETMKDVSQAIESAIDEASKSFIAERKNGRWSVSAGGAMQFLGYEEQDLAEASRVLTGTTVANSKTIVPAVARSIFQARQGAKRAARERADAERVQDLMACYRLGHKGHYVTLGEHELASLVRVLERHGY